MPNKKQEPPKESKLYDSTLKALFNELAEEIIPCLLTDAYLPGGLTEDELNVELNRNTLSMDVGRPIVFKGYSATFNLEVQSGPDNDLLPRNVRVCDQFIPQVSPSYRLSGAFAL